MKSPESSARGRAENDAPERIAATRRLLRTPIRGFSLLEMIGVLAVMAVLAGALAPSVFQLIQQGYQTAEAQSLATVAQALERYVRKSKSIPTEADDDWSTAVAGFASIAPQRVLRNERNFRRKLFVDRKFFSNSNQVFPGYTQDQGLAALPFSPRMMLISSLEGELGKTLSSNAEFTAVWEQTGGAKFEESKSLLVERINLAPLFVRVVLNNAHADQAGFALETGSEAAVAASSGVADGVRTIYVLADTRMQLNAAPYPGGDTLRQQIVGRDMSLRYQLEGSNWHWVY